MSQFKKNNLINNDITFALLLLIFSFLSHIALGILDNYLTNLVSIFALGLLLFTLRKHSKLLFLIGFLFIFALSLGYLPSGLLYGPVSIGVIASVYETNFSETIGFFEYANEGTVLLDGIAELSLSLQAKLLRFLTDGSFRRVGEEKEHHANVRVICTSQEPMEKLLEQGKLRSDLFHRLNVLALNVPPLRERVEDIQPLTDGFLQEISTQLKISMPQYDADFLNYLKGQPWQGNVRELYNVLYRACSLVKNNQLDIESLNLKPVQSAVISADDFGEQTLDEIMGQYEASVLRAFYAQYPSTRKLAQRLGVSHTAIANKLKQYGISK